ncbi:MAG TPA: phage major capsid protein [Phycisphaerae bacterium]|nr:phage major capsid protein [Phycisphaerae bacterium]
MPDDLPRTLHSTIETYIREVEVDILNSRKLTALLEANGRIEMDMGGDEVKWPVQYRRHKPKGWADGDTETFEPKDRFKTAKLDWRGYTIGDMVTKKQRLMNKGVNAIIDIWSRVTDDLMDDMREDFGDELLIDGGLTANYKRLCGIETFMADDGSVAATDLVAFPDDTYAGIKTKRAAYGGTWTTGTYPDGHGDAHYDFYSPILVNYTSSNWIDSSNDTWAKTALLAMRAGILWSRKRKSRQGMLNMIMLEQKMYREFLALLDPKEKLEVRRGEPRGLVALGFDDVVNFDGVDVTWEYGMPSDTGYGFNINHMGLWSLQEGLFVPEGPDYDLATKKWQFSVDMMGQAWFRPRYFVKFFKYAT